MDHSELLGLVGGMYDKLVQDVATRVFQMVEINRDQLLADVKTSFDYNEIPIDYERLAYRVCLSSLANEVSLTDLATEIDVAEVAGNVDLGDLAGSFDLADIAGEIDESDIAEQLDQDAIRAALVADGDLAIQIADRLKDNLRVVFAQED